MITFNCANPLNIASTDYVDCVAGTVSGSLQTQIDSIDSSVTLQEAYDNGDGTIASTGAKPVQTGDLTVTGTTNTNRLLVPLGSNTVPSIAFSVNTDTGIYSNSGNDLRFVLNGIERLVITTSQFFSNAQFQSNFTSTETIPAFAKAGDNNTGMYFVSADVIGFTAGGKSRVTISGVNDETDGVGIDGNLTVTGTVTADAGTFANSLTVSGIPAVLVDGSRAFTSTVGGVDPVSTTDLVTKNYVDNQIITLRNELLVVSGALQADIDQLRADLEVCCPPPPVVTSFMPTSGTVGTVVTIAGTDFTGATAVIFDADAAITFSVDSDIQITATVPAGATTGLIQVTTPAGSGSSATPFTVIPPPSGQLVSLDLDDGLEVLTNNTNVDVGIGNIWSVSAWFKADAADVTNAVMTVADDSGTISYIWMRYNASGDLTINTTIGSAPGSNLKLYDYPNAITTASWTFLVATWDGTDLIMYKNGSVLTPTKSVDNSGTMGTNARAVTLGGGTPNDMDVTTLTLDGKHHSYAIWNSELSADEVTVLYNSGAGEGIDYASDSGDYVSSANLKHWWRLGFDSLDIGKDYGNHTTLIDVMDGAIGVDATDIVNDFQHLGLGLERN